MYPQVTSNEDDVREVTSSFRLPCGRIVSNRLVKVATHDHINAARIFGGPPTSAHFHLYSSWGTEAWGMIITGEVHVAPAHGPWGRHVIISTNLNDANIAPFQRVASAIRGSECLKQSAGDHPAVAIMQLTHGGNLSGHSRGVLSGFFSGKKLEMCESELYEVVADFVRGATDAVECGFDGIQLNASDGSLLAQFMSPKKNRRKDEYGQPLFLLRKIVNHIRSILPEDFVVGVKISLSDYRSSGVSDEQVVSQLCELTKSGGVDFIEIVAVDGNHQSDINSTGHEKLSGLALRALQQQRTSKLPPPVIVLTNGFTTRSQMVSTLNEQRAHLLGCRQYPVLEDTIHPLIPSQQRSAHVSMISGRQTEVPTQALTTASGWLPEWTSMMYTWRRSAKHHQIADGKMCSINRNTLVALLEVYFDRHAKAMVTAVAVLLFCVLFLTSNKATICSSISNIANNNYNLLL
ncbi:FMN-linked oxidoreductase [Rickenella mellea]|uniref:FMN-linked oxidoreductase n=1 Tax=Rickenella mellea TaxID=50990 RepID=A0A4Y7QE99_9AGAM|nr:FMN-linked oxidoreductase [Rickenella mellea]